MYAGEGAGVSVHREGVSGVRSVTVKNTKQRRKQEVQVRGGATRSMRSLIKYHVGLAFIQGCRFTAVPRLFD